MLGATEFLKAGHGSVLKLVAGSGESEYQRLLDNLPAGAYACDTEGLITYYNEHAVGLWGRAPKLNDPVDRFCGSFKLFTCDGAPMRHDECWMALALREGHGFNGEEIIVERPDGTRLTALAHANPVRDHAGRLLGAVNVLVDISDRVRARKLLEHADRTKNEFLAILAHELRNPLAPIRNAIEILRLGGSSGFALDVIDRQSRQMARLIEDLLDVARITANKLEIRKEATTLGRVVDIALETARPSIDGARHELEVALPAEAIALHADSTRLAQVVSNLLNNAAKFTPPAGRIALLAEQRDDQLLIRVRDSGIGVPKEIAEDIFRMFEQAERGLDRRAGGLGLGLTLARRIAQMHGGDVTVKSDGPGRGSEFTVSLPLAAIAVR